MVFCPVIGPVSGGYLTDQVSWRAAFYINVPVGILAVLLLSLFLEDPPYITNAKPGRFDTWGFGLLGIWSASLQFICDKGQEDDRFGSPYVRWAAVLFVVAFAAFLFREFLDRKPLVRVRLLGESSLAGRFTPLPLSSRSSTRLLWGTTLNLPVSK